MNILERKALINSKQSISQLLHKSPEGKNVNEYLKNFNRPPIQYYIPPQVINTLYQISYDCKLANNPQKRFNMQNEILEPYGFKPLASGTSRRAFYCIYDPEIIIKLGSDMIGRSDNLSESILQKILMPFCPKILDVDPTGSIMLAERVETMTEKDYKEWIKEIFMFIESYYQLGYLFEDIGLYSFKNWGIRLGFGPVLLDFPYLYQIDWKKMKCDRIDPTTHKKCGGTIGYNYESVLSEIICHRCHVRYSAQYLSKPINGEMMESLLLGRKRKMFNPYNIKVAVAKGNRIVYDPNDVNVGSVQVTPTPATQQPIINQTQQISQPLKVVQGIKVPGYPIAYMPDNEKYMIQQRSKQEVQPTFIVPVSNSDNIDKQIEQSYMNNPFKTYERQNSCNSCYNNIPAINPVTQTPFQVQTQQQETSVETAKEYEYYIKDGRRYIFYPKPLKNDLIQNIKNIEKNYGTDVALFIASRLEVEYIPQSQWANMKKAPEVAVQKPFPTTPQRPITVAPVAQPTQNNSGYQTINTMVRPNPVQTVIAPATKPVQLKVEDPTHWVAMKQNLSPSTGLSQEEAHPTTGLEIVKPMSPEEIEAQELKNRKETGILGYVGIPVVDTARAKEAIPRIKAMVEARFSNFVLDEDTEKQSFMLSQDIGRFIMDDMKHLMNDDGKGLLVIASRTVDTHNKDCFNIKVLNYNAFVFSTILYPVEPANNIPYSSTPVQQDSEEMSISITELIKFFEDAMKKFDVSKYNTAETAKKALIEFLYNAAAIAFKGKITVPRAIKESTAYVNQVVNFREKPINQQKPKDNTVANAL